MAYHKVKTEAWLEAIFRQAKEKAIYGLKRSGQGLVYQRLREKTEVVLFETRPTEPIKLFFYFPSELTATLPEEPFREEEKRVLLGVKACDLEALKTADFVYRLGDVVEPHYESRRNNTLLIGSDCTQPNPTCFCSLHGRSCYPQDYFDINLSPLNKEVMIETSSPRGEEFLSELNLSLFEVTEADLKLRDKNRREYMERLKTINTPFEHQKPYSEIVRKSSNAAAWKKYGQEMCVQCHACNLGCPTCYCFSFSDLAEKSGMKRYKNWDSCLAASFARMASGATPRHNRWERFRYHYYHKFDFLNTALGFDACTGCGRCIEGCLGKIDKRQVLSDLEKETNG